MGEYKIPLEIFNCEVHTPYVDEMFAEETKYIIQSVLDDYGIDAEICSVAFGSMVVTFNVIFGAKVSPRRVLAVIKEFGLRTGIDGIRCHTDSEGGLVCVEVPNKKRVFPELGEILQSSQMQAVKTGELRVALGKNTRNRSTAFDLSKMVHMLVSGESGSGKSVFLNSIITSLVYQCSPKNLRLLFIAPKTVELSLYNGLPHALTEKPITGLREGIEALGWAIEEMNRRYCLFDDKIREGIYISNIDEYNKLVENDDEKLAKIVVVIDELAHLILANKPETESKIQTLTQKARGAGIHLIVSTQHPTPDVLTGVVKSNFPTRVSFKVASEIHSRVILDFPEAQLLLGKGDYLYSRPGVYVPERMQAAYVSSETVLRLVEYVKTNYALEKDETIVQFIQGGAAKKRENINGVEPLYVDALKQVIQVGTTSITMIQRAFAVGYNKAGQIVEWMENNGYISEFDGSKSRKVFITMEEFEEMFGQKHAG